MGATVAQVNLQDFLSCQTTYLERTREYAMARTVGARGTLSSHCGQHRGSGSASEIPENGGASDVLCATAGPWATPSLDLLGRSPAGAAHPLSDEARGGQAGTAA